MAIGDIGEYPEKFQKGECTMAANQLSFFRRPQRLGFLGVTAILLILSGCYEMDLGHGAMRASFAIDYQGSTCESAGIHSIKAVLNDGINVYKVTTDCADYGIWMENIPAGLYDLTLYGLDDQNKVVVDSLDYDHLYVQILGNDIVAPNIEMITLTEATVQLWTRWSVGYYTCGTLDIQAFFFEVMGPNSDKPVFKATLECSKNGTENGQYRVIEDKKKELAQNEFTQIIVTALEKDDRPRGEQFQIVWDVVDDPAEGELSDPGPGGIIDLTFQCNQAGCVKRTSCVK